MTKAELERKLKKAGWVITHGKAHDQATNPAKPGVKIPIARHAGDIPIGTAKAILKEAGIE
jgi:predicted RNA binding protein YcfA (HicA-like mRNA interferase family)